MSISISSRKGLSLRASMCFRASSSGVGSVVCFGVAASSSSASARHAKKNNQQSRNNENICTSRCFGKTEDVLHAFFFFFPAELKNSCQQTQLIGCYTYFTHNSFTVKVLRTEPQRLDFMIYRNTLKQLLVTGNGTFKRLKKEAR